MVSTIHASFKNSKDAICAAKELVTIGMGADDIGLLLPDQHKAHAPGADTSPHLVVNYGSSGHTQAVSPADERHTRQTTGLEAENTEEGVGLGALLGLLTALCVPGIGMFVGSGAIIAGLLSGGATLGGIAGGIYGYMIVHGVPHETAKAVFDNLGRGATTLRATAVDAGKEAEIVKVIENYGGHLIALDH